MTDDTEHDCAGCDRMRDKGISGTCPECDAEFDFEEEGGDPSKRTLKETFDLGNELAREFYRLRGYVVPEGYRFDLATHPHEVACWAMAEAAFEMIEGTELDDIKNQLEDTD